jgi:hypothetical protein
MAYRYDGGRTEIYPSMDRFRQAIQNEKGTQDRSNVTDKYCFILDFILEFKAVNHVLDNPQQEVQTIDTSPILTGPTQTAHQHIDGNHRARNHFQRRSHSHSQCPWPLAHRPYRGDYSIHMDWHPRLPHHRLTCLC